MKASQITQLIEKQAPVNLAEKWDNVGYQIGSASENINKVLLSLDVSEEVVDEAIKNKADMIISHHPFFFSGIKRIDLNDYKGKLIKKILDNGLTVYSAHTNIDKAALGINELLAKKLELKDIKPLKPDPVNQKFYKFAIYVPEEESQKIEEALFDLEVGKLDSEKYKNCSFKTEGIGSFEPTGKANPAIGEAGKLERVNEVKIETVIPGSEIRSVLNKITKVHPYEEMAYDLFEVKPQNLKIKEGLGRIGKTEKPYTPDEFVRFVKERLNLDYLREAGKKPEKIKKVAICTGAGSEFITLAKHKGADVYITGDLKYHEGQRAKEEGIWVLDAGHFGTEKQVVEIFREFLEPVKAEIEILNAKSSQDYLNLI